jgi:hypothetical protein
MATAFSTLLKIALPTQGELSGSWGDVVNNNITSMVEEAIAGLKTIDTWSGNSATLSTANGTTAESRAAMLLLTDTTSDLSGAATLICPALSKIFIVKNGTGQAVTIKTASGTGIAIANGNTSIVFCDGTNVVEAVTGITGNLDVGGNLTVGGNATVTGTTTFNGGTLTLGDSAADNVVFGADVNSSIIPNTDDTYDLGSASQEWRNLHLDGTANIDALVADEATIDSININGKVITMTGDTSDTAVFTAGTNGTLTIVTTDAAGAAANITITADGTAELAGTTVTLNSGGGITLDADGGTITFADAGSSLGTVTSSGFTGNVVGNVTGNVSGTAATVTGAAQSNITSVGTLTTLTIDDVLVDGKVITMTGSSGDTATITAGTNGTLDIATTDGSGAAGNIQITADGTAELAGTTVTLDSEGGITLDANGGTITFADNGSSLGTITSDGYTGNLVGNVTGNVSGSAGSATGNAATATALATARTIGGTSFDGTGDIAVALATAATHVTVTDNESTNEENLITFVEDATSSTGNVGLEMDGTLTYNPSTGKITATGFIGALTGNADTATVATTVTITDNESTNEDNAIIFTAGGDVDGGNIGLESDGTLTYNPSTGKITATGFIGALTGNVTGNLTGTVSTAAQNTINSATSLAAVGALNAGSITSGFGTIDTGSSAITTTGVITGGTVEVTTDTAAGDNAAIGYTSGEGLILTGQGSTTDVTIKNDADATVASIATGTTIFTLNDDAFVTGRAAGTQTPDNDGTMDLSVSNFFTYTPDSDDTITLSNPAVGQAGIIFLDNSAGRNLSFHGSVIINADVLNALDTAGKYMLSYYCTATSGDDTILVSATGALT